MATPIETNTEDLREILQAVYDLKNSAGGGSSAPDLVITFSNPTDEGITGHPEKFSYDLNEVFNTFNKVTAGQTVNCCLNAEYSAFAKGLSTKTCTTRMIAIAETIVDVPELVGVLTIIFPHYYNHTGDNNFCEMTLEFLLIANGQVEFSVDCQLGYTLSGEHI